MNRTYVTEVSVTPFTIEQRRRLEALTAVRGLYRDLAALEAVRVAAWIESGSIYGGAG